MEEEEKSFPSPNPKRAPEFPPLLQDLPSCYRYIKTNLTYLSFTVNSPNLGPLDSVAE